MLQQGRKGLQPLPGQIYGFPNSIQLPMRQIIMNPFPSAQDMFDPLYTKEQPVLLMLKTAQKYFMPDQSIVAPESLYF